MDIEFRKPIHALQLTKAVEWDFACTSDKLQQLSTFFFVERTDCTPEPLNLRGGGLIVVIFGMIFPVINVDVGKAGDEKLELLLVEDRNEFRRNNVMEA